MTSLDLDFTRGCNMNCNHCFADAHTPMPAELSTDEYRIVLTEAREINPKLDRVSWGLGGEALTRPDIFDLLDHGHKLGFAQVLTTNGLLVTEKAAARIAATGCRVSVSLDGATDATHESLRVIPGSLGLAQRGIRRLKAAGATVGANITLTKHNVHELDALMDVGLALDLDFLSIGNILPAGRALLNPDLLLDEVDVQNVIEVARARYGYPIPVTTFDGVLDLLFNLERVLDTGRFTPRASSAGRGKVVIRPNGDVWPCQILPLRAGNVREEPLAKILESEVFERVKRVVEEQELAEKTGCGGGCACTFIMNNERQTFAATGPGAYRALTVTVPDDIGARVKAALAAKRNPAA